MKFRIVRVKDRLTNEKTHNIANIVSDCKTIAGIISDVGVNTQKNIMNGLDKDLDISFYKKNCLDDISNIRKLLDKIENNINKLI